MNTKDLLLRRRMMMEGRSPLPPRPDMLHTPLTFEAKEDDTPVLAVSEDEEKTLLYSLDNGVTWESKTIGEVPETLAILNAGETIQFKGGNFCPGGMIAVVDISGGDPISKPFYAYGNMMSLLSAENFENLTEVPEHCFDDFFAGSLVDIKPDHCLLLPATTLAESCYNGMFSGCTSLASAPELPAITLAVQCYAAMFYGCTGLTAAPELPATTLAESCYNGMFFGCTSLTSAPELPATTLASRCYWEIFSGCTSLASAPELPAITLAVQCYAAMFYGCTGLTAAPELPATTLAESCYNSMFSGCTSLTSAPELPATTLAESCYNGMFSGCENLSEVKCDAEDISAQGCVSEWLNNVSASGTFTKKAGVTWPSGDSGIPSGWTVVEV